MAKKRPRKRPVKKDKPNIERPELETNKDDLEVDKLKLELKWWRVKVFAPYLTAIIIGLGYLGNWYKEIEQRKLETERQRQETLTNRKREFASDNPSIRIAAALALSEYPKEAIQVLIHSLGTLDPHTKEEDIAFTTAIKTSLSQIGEDAIAPLIKELRRLQAEVTVIFAPLYQKRLSKIIKGVEAIPESGLTWSVTRDFSMDVLLNNPPEDVKNKLKEAGATDGETNLVIPKLKDIWSSRPQLKVAHKNAVEILAELLCRHHIERGQLWGLDLSGAFLPGANLSDASLHYTNLSGANLIDANLSSAILVGANLSDTNLLRANLAGADLAYAKLSGAYLPDVDLTGVKGFKDIDSFIGANLRGVKGLSKEDLEYAKSGGAIID